MYLIFTKGYAPGRLEQSTLCEEAIRLGKLVATLMPDEPEALGLVALLLLQHSRRAARYVGVEGGDARPVRVISRNGLGVQGGDRGLQLIRTRSAEA
ncbi:putative ECF subfamily RNA polymerase sigma-24 subunit [Rhodococcus opacus M213]|uniref:Putative ECF subfamily RNA polymerase sigma-24 subunit n=1 Tax=Rhodococcus opacus M213 TaxID=1129896 RepID=K8XNZ0_RHOOP|nr:DUF6596 domain-containing protein [Rhodococcus opacus]EKT83363.1 putative ECF subfamily RNA polymerase sigma-24 subunit [Rhodococcus opacus M213]